MAHKMLHYIFSLALVFTCIVAEAQQASKSAAQTAEHATTSPELQGLIAALSGKWSLKVKLEPSSEMPNGFEGTGEETWRAGPGGITLIEEETIPSPSGNLYLLGIIWWDGQTKSLHGMECNSQLPFTCDLKGGLNDITMKWDGKQFALDEQETHNGKKSLWHEAWSEITPTTYTQTGDSSAPGGSPKRLMTIHATKAEGSHP
jgi:hypothetical protein